MALAGKLLMIATPTAHPPLKFPTNIPRTSTINTAQRLRTFAVVSAQESDSQQQLDLSVLRFTLGIPGLDESYLPQWIGVAFGSLVVLNHFLSSSPPSPAQLRTEALGICLAAFSTALPYLGRFLELIAVQDVFCVRGYWNTPEDVSRAQTIAWFKGWTKQVGFRDLKETLYFPQISDAQLQKILPKGACSLLVEPVFAASESVPNIATNVEGFVLLVSSAKYAYTDRDRTWIRAIAKKFQAL